MTDSIEQMVRKALVDGDITEKEIDGFLKAMRVIKKDTGFGMVTCELKHGSVINIEVKLHWKPTTGGLITRTLV